MIVFYVKNDLQPLNIGVKQRCKGREMKTLCWNELNVPGREHLWCSGLVLGTCRLQGDSDSVWHFVCTNDV